MPSSAGPPSSACIFSSPTTTRSSIRTSEVNIIATEAPPPLTLTTSGEDGGSGCAFIDPLSAPSSSGAVQFRNHHRVVASAAAAADAQQYSSSSGHPTLLDGSDMSVHQLQSCLHAFEPLRTSSYLSEEDFSSDIIAVAFGTFDTKLGNNIDYHYPHTKGTDGTAAAVAAEGVAGTRTQQNPHHHHGDGDSSSRAAAVGNNGNERVCSINFNKLNALYKLQDFCFPDGSHDSFVDTIPFVISSTGSVNRLPNGSGSDGPRSNNCDIHSFDDATPAVAGGSSSTDGGMADQPSPASPSSHHAALYPYPIFGFACYHLFKDPSVHRGAVQRSFLVLSRRPLFYYMRRIARQAFVPFFDAVPSTDVAAHRRFVRTVYESLFVAFRPFSDSFHLNLKGMVGYHDDDGDEGGEGEGGEVPTNHRNSNTTAATITPPSNSDGALLSEYDYQVRNRSTIAAALAATPFASPEEALRDVRYFSLVFDWPAARSGSASDSVAVRRATSSSPHSSCSPHSSPSPTQAAHQHLSSPLPEGTATLALGTSFGSGSNYAATGVGGGVPVPLNPEQMPTIPITTVLRERAPTIPPHQQQQSFSRRQSVMGGGGDGMVPSSTPTPRGGVGSCGGGGPSFANNNSMSMVSNGSQTSSTVQSAAVSSMAAAIASAVATNSSVAFNQSSCVRFVDERPVGGGLSTCEVEVDAPLISRPTSPNTANANMHHQETTADISQRPPLSLNLHFPLLVPRSDASLIQQLSYGTSVKTLLKWFGADKLAVIHYCMLARYPILFVGQHADQVSTAVCASAHLLAPFTGSPFSYSPAGSVGNSAASFNNNATTNTSANFSAVGGGSNGVSSSNNTQSLVGAANSANGQQPHSNASSSPMMTIVPSPTAAAVELDVCAFLPYATLDMMDRVQEVVANPSYANLLPSALTEAQHHFSQQQQQQHANAGGAPPSPSTVTHGGNGVGYYIAVGATNVFLVNRDVRGMLKCNVNDGTVTFCNNSNVKRTIGDSKGLAESRRLWSAAALNHLHDKFVKESYYRLWIQKLNLEIKAECDARLVTGAHFKTLMLGGQQPSSGGGGGGGTGGILSIFESTTQHITTEDSEGFLLIDDIDELMANNTKNNNNNGNNAATSDGMGAANTAITFSRPPLYSNTTAAPSRVAFNTTTNFTAAAAAAAAAGVAGGTEAGDGAADASVIGGANVTDDAAATAPSDASGSRRASPSPSGAAAATAAADGTVSGGRSPADSPRAVVSRFRNASAFGSSAGGAPNSVIGFAASRASSIGGASAALYASPSSVHVEFSSALSNYLHLAQKNRRLLTETDGWYQRLLSALQRTVASESGEELVALGAELAAFSAVEEACVGPDGSVELCPSRPLDACAYQEITDRDVRLRVVVDFRQRSFCFIDALTRGNYRALVRRSNLYVSDFFLANVVGAEAYNLPQQVVLYQSDCQQVLYANRIKYKTSGTVYLTRNFLLFQAGKLALNKRHQIVPFDLIRGVSKYSKGLLFENASVRMMIDMLPSREEEMAQGSCGPNLYVDKKSMNETTALLSYTNISNNSDMFYEILLGLYLKQKSIVERMRGIPQLHTIPNGGPERMKTVSGTEMICPLWIPRGLYTTPNAIVYDEVWENQRLYPLIGWKSRLLPSDPASFSDFSCLRELSFDVNSSNSPKANSKKLKKAGGGGGGSVTSPTSSTANAARREELAEDALDPCPVPGFAWVDSEWRMACELHDAAASGSAGTAAGGGGGGGDFASAINTDGNFVASSSAQNSNNNAAAAVGGGDNEHVPLTTDLLLATNRGSHKQLDKKENKFDQGFLYSFTSNWTVADGFRTHECAGGVIRRRLWVRRRRLVVNPELDAYYRRLELEREFGGDADGGHHSEGHGVDPAVLSGAIGPDESIVVAVGEGSATAHHQHVDPNTANVGGVRTRMRTGRNPPPPPSKALLKKVDSLAAIFNAMHDGGNKKIIQLDENEGADDDVGDLRPIRQTTLPPLAPSSSPLRNTNGGGAGFAASPSQHSFLTAAALRSVPDGRAVHSSWRTSASKKRDGGGGGDARSVSTDSTDVIDPSEVEESLSAPIGEQNDDGAAPPSSSSGMNAAAAEAQRRAAIDAQGHLPPQWEGQRRKSPFDRDASL